MKQLNPPNNPPNSGSAIFYSFDAVQERLVETVQSWWRMPGGGSWPFASDGPWNLIRKQWEDWDARDPKPLKPLPLRRREIALMEEATEWLLLIPEDDRRVVVLGLVYLAKGWKQVPWTRLMRDLGMTRGVGGLRMRYERALASLTFRLNGVSETQARALGRRNPGGWAVKPDGAAGGK
jgi:hypothetical protein